MTVFISINDHNVWFPGHQTGSCISSTRNNEEERFNRTVESTARIMKFVNNGLLKPTDYIESLHLNSEHLGISPEFLHDLVVTSLENETDEPSETSQIH